MRQIERRPYLRHRHKYAEVAHHGIANGGFHADIGSRPVTPAWSMPRAINTGFQVRAAAAHEGLNQHLDK